MDDVRIRDFIEQVSNRTATPGAGSTVAITASMAVATILMAVRFSEGNTLTEKNKRLFTLSVEELENIRDGFISLAHKEEESFLILSAAFKMPSDTAKEQKEKDKKIQEGLVQACDVPMRVIHDVRRVQVVVEKIYPLVKNNIISDVGVGLELLQSCAHASSFNIYANLRFLKNTPKKFKIKSSAESKISSIDKLNKLMLKKIQNYVNP